MSIELDIESEGLQGVHQVLNQLSKMGSTLGGVELHARSRDPYSVNGRSIGANSNNATILKALKNHGRDFVTSSDSDVQKIADAFTKELNKRVGAALSKATFMDAWSSKRAKQTRSYQGRVRRSQSAFDRAADKYFSGFTDRSTAIDADADAFFEGGSGNASSGIDAEFDRAADEYFGVDASDIGKAPGPLKLVEKDAFARQLAAACLKKAMLEFMDQVSGRIESQSSNTGSVNQNYSAGWMYLKPKITGGWIKPIGKASGQLLDNLNPDGLGARNIRLRKS